MRPPDAENIKADQKEAHQPQETDVVIEHTPRNLTSTDKPNLQTSSWTQKLSSIFNAGRNFFAWVFSYIFHDKMISWYITVILIAALPFIVQYGAGYLKKAPPTAISLFSKGDLLLVCTAISADALGV